MDSELDDFGRTVKRLAEEALSDIGQGNCSWHVSQTALALSPIVAIAGPAGPIEFQIDYEDQVEMSASQLESLVRQHVRRIFSS